MIPDQWYAILESKEVRSKYPVGVTRLGEKMVLWRDEQNQVCCIADKCCHRGASLAAGKIVNHHVECPFHGFQYDATGKVVLIPAIGKSTPVPANFKIKSYLVKEAFDFIWLWYGEPVENLPEIPVFEELTRGFSYSTLSEVWTVHYSRAIENQLDVVHLPFVHKTTIGKGNKTVVNGPVVKWAQNRMTFYVDNVLDKGQKPLKANEIENYENLFGLQLQMPNTWQNIISEKVRISAAFAPIDEENTMIYMRFCQNFLHIPLLKQLINVIGGKLLDKIILHQDRRVVLTQIPKKSEMKMRENLVPGDLPIIEYRKRRADLQNTI